MRPLLPDAPKGRNRTQEAGPTSPGSSFKIGYVQFAPALGDLDATLARLEALAPAWKGAALIVLPELCNSGYRFTSREMARTTSENLADSKFVRFLEAECRRNRLYIASGMNEQEGEHGYNTAVLVGPTGLVGKYRKVHLFGDEPDYFQPGNLGFPLFAVGPCRVGMLICFDWIFPEAWRILALRGADLIAHPSNLVLPGLCQSAVPVHAVTNRVFVVTANRVGTEGDLTFTGQSLIAGPDAKVLAEASATGEEVGMAEVDLMRARDKMITPRNHALEDRRPEEYLLLVQPPIPPD